MAWAVPRIGGIQRTTAVLVAVASIALLAAGHRAAALGCAVGGAVMIVNLFLLEWVGRWIVAVATDVGGASRVGIVAAPMKLLFIIGVVALLIGRTNIDVPGFALGLAIQSGAILLETWRVSGRDSAEGARAGDQNREGGSELNKPCSR